jgi:hypothetical protein
MTDKDKEPYVKMALDFKNTHASLIPEQKNILSNKKKRPVQEENDVVPKSQKRESESGMDEYVHSILVPFVKKSYEYFKSQGIV